MTKYVKTYPCPTCGGRASGRGHLCNDARHVCAKMIDNIEYICRNCGRLSVYDSLLCKPEMIDRD